jgi:uncharacterized protein YecE (DUF72 family)
MSKHPKGILKIGTSNITLPGNRSTFPPAFQQKSRLHYYASLFNTLEVNSSFYKLPMPATFEKWSNDVPKNFRFSLKLWKEITHVKDLKIDLKKIDQFFSAANFIGDKKGCLLIQFPGKINLGYYRQIEKILHRIQRVNHLQPWKVVVEFRNADWYVSETMELLDEYNSSFVLHDIKKGKNQDVNKNADVVYIRYHGPQGDYRGSYPDSFLLEQAGKIKRWLISGLDVYAYFNNTIGNAFENARTLMAMTESNLR